MINPTVNTINLLNNNLAELKKTAKEVAKRIKFDDMYCYDNKGMINTYLFRNVTDYLEAQRSIDVFVSVATTTRHLLCRKFAKYRIDRSHFQGRYDDIINDLYDRIYNAAQACLEGMNKIPKELIAKNKERDMENLNSDIFQQSQKMLNTISTQRAEWPVIPKYKKNTQWHNRGVKKHTQRT